MRNMILIVALISACATDAADNTQTSSAQQAEICTNCGSDGDGYWDEPTAEATTTDWVFNTFGGWNGAWYVGCHLRADGVWHCVFSYGELANVICDFYPDGSYACYVNTTCTGGCR